VAVFAALVAAHVPPLRALARHVPRAAASIAPDGRARLGQVPVPRGHEPKAGVHTIAYPRKQAGEGTPYPLPPQLLHVGGCEHWAAKCPIWPHRMHAAISSHELKKDCQMCSQERLGASSFSVVFTRRAMLSW
jgi:hypothetical protein